MGSTSLFERLEACLAEERAELEKRHGLLLQELMADPHFAAHDMLRQPEPNEVPVPFNRKAFASPLASATDDFWQLSGAASPSLDSAASLLLDEVKEENLQRASEKEDFDEQVAKERARRKRRQAKIHSYVYSSDCEAMSSSLSEPQPPETDHKVPGPVNYWIGDEDPEAFASPLASATDDFWQLSGAASPSLDSAASLLLDEVKEENLQRASEKEDFDEQAWCMFWWHELWSSEAFEELLPFEAQRKQAAPAVLLQCLPFYLSVEDFLSFRLLCRETSDRKVWNRQIIAAVKPMRVEGYVEYFQFLFSSTDPNLVGPPPTLPRNCKGFETLVKHSEHWWKFGDQHAMLRFFETMRRWSRESNYAEVAHLLLYIAVDALQIDDKSLRHFFARDVLHWLEHGDELSQSLASKCLKNCEMGVGRFNKACLKALKHLTDEANEHHVWFAAMGGIETLERCERKRRQKLGKIGKKIGKP